MFRTVATVLGAAALLLTQPVFAQDKPVKDDPADAKTLERGRYITMITGCNDCHTPGYPESGGTLPAEKWLTGGGLGFRGPWGTTWPTNLRLYFQNLTEDEWVTAGKTLKARPPMPWFAVNVMAEDDLRVMYRFVRSLGPAGVAAPSALAPREKPATPTIDWPMPPK
jgi:mono/diheme cytochrome c family protein